MRVPRMVLASISLLWILIGSLECKAQVASPNASLQRYRQHVETLCKPEMAGRSGEGARLAAAYIVKEFQEIGLEPLFGGSFEQPIDGLPGQGPAGWNLGAAIRGNDPKLRDEWVILCAHYDHLGVRNGRVYPGADDNAAGVAMLLEVARSMASAPQRPARSVMFVSFDLEEVALQGSRFFVSNAPVPVEQMKLVLVSDLMGRALGGVCERNLFVLGAESARGLRTWVDDASMDIDLDIGQIGSDVLLIDRSDYGPFRLRKVPFLFLTSGESPEYHTPQDVPETLNWSKCLSVTELFRRLTNKAAMADKVPTWDPDVEPTVKEVVVIREVLKQLLEKKKELEITEPALTMMGNAIRSVDRYEERGTLTLSERRAIVRIAQFVLFTVL